MKLNNKGFTVVELLTSFTLIMVIMVFLFEIVLQLKDIYVSDALKAKIMDKNAIVATTINNHLNGEVAFAHCDDNTCIINGQIDNFIKVNDDNVDTDKNTIEIYGRKVSMPRNSKIKSFNLKVSGPFGLLDENGNVINSNNDNTFIKISYVIGSSDLEEDITFNYIYSYKGITDWGDLQNPDLIENLS